MPGASKTVFTLVSAATQMRHTVEFWQDYGAVAPSMWTTNGSLPYVADLCSQYVAHGRVTVEDSTLPAGLDFSDQVALLESLRDAYRTWMASL